MPSPETDRAPGAVPAPATLPPAPTAGRLLPMLASTDLADAQRQLEICNACRYCEGICAVFPALERRTEFGEQDLLFLGNLCHDCRACFYVCPFAPPHEWGVNIPVLLAGVREQTYRRFAWPGPLGRFVFGRPRVVVGAFLVAFIGWLLISLAVAGPDGLVTANAEPGAFYRVVPWAVMFVPASLLGLFGLLAAVVGGMRYWRAIREVDGARPADIAGAAWDAATLRYLDGGGPGCDYPDEAPSRVRATFHHLVAWGFVGTFISTTLAFINQEFLGIQPPFPYLSGPVIFGTVGGVMQVVGAIGLLRLKARADREPASPDTLAMDRLFLGTIIVLNATGLALLALRETAGMGLLLDVHLAAMVAFFVSAPYGKLVHAVYRYAALVRHRLETRVEARHGAA